MAKKPEHDGEHWSREDVGRLGELAQEDTPTRVIGLKLGRSEDAIYGKAAKEGISLDPPNQRPYNRR